MEADYFDHILGSFKKRTPFKPFTVVLVNGDKFEVDFPDALSYRYGRGVYFAPGGTFVMFDHEGVSQVIDDLMEQEKEQTG